MPNASYYQYRYPYNGRNRPKSDHRKPEHGDIVKYVGDYELSTVHRGACLYYVTQSLYDCTTYDTPVVHKIKLEPFNEEAFKKHHNLNQLYTSSNFRIVNLEPSAKETTLDYIKQVPSYVLLDSAFNRVASFYDKSQDADRTANQAETDAYIEINEKVSSLLRANPTATYHVFKFDKTGSLPTLNVKWSS